MDVNGDQVSFLGLAVSATAMITLVLTRSAQILAALREGLKTLGNEVIKCIDDYHKFCERLREAMKKLKGT
jgi:hypothetical protein